MGRYRGLVMALLGVVCVAGGWHAWSGAAANARTRNAHAVDIPNLAIRPEDRALLGKAKHAFEVSRSVHSVKRNEKSLLALPAKPVGGTRHFVRASNHWRRHVVSMVYVGDATERYAVVDGRFCVKGSRLPHGVTVSRIGSGAVLLSSNGRSRWFFVRRGGVSGSRRR